MWESLLDYGVCGVVQQQWHSEAVVIMRLRVDKVQLMMKHFQTIIACWPCIQQLQFQQRLDLLEKPLHEKLQQVLIGSVLKAISEGASVVRYVVQMECCNQVILHYSTYFRSSPYFHSLDWQEPHQVLERYLEKFLWRNFLIRINFPQRIY